MLCKFLHGCGSKLNRGKPQVLVHVSTYQGNPFWNSGFLSHSHMEPKKGVPQKALPLQVVYFFFWGGGFLEFVSRGVSLFSKDAPMTGQQATCYGQHVGRSLLSSFGRFSA